MLAAPAAIPPKPKIPATIARIINVTVQRNIIFNFKLKNRTFYKSDLFVSQSSCLLTKTINSNAIFFSAINYKS